MTVSDMRTIYIPNDKADSVYTLELTVVDRCDKRIRLKNAVFDLFKLNADGGTLVRKDLCTDEEGKAVVGNLGCGKYRLIERCAPPGYSCCCKEGWIFEINHCTADAGGNIEQVICNYRKKCCKCPCCGK